MGIWGRGGPIRWGGQQARPFSISQKLPALKDHLSCIYSNVDMLLNKRTELLQVIARDEPDAICLTEILHKNSRLPVELSGYSLRNMIVSQT